MSTKKQQQKNINCERVAEAYVRLLFQNKKRPTHRMIADETGLGMRTVFRHLKKLNLVSDIKQAYKLKTDEIIQALFESAKNGKAPEVKLWLQFIEEWSEKSNVHHTGELEVRNINFIEAQPQGVTNEES